MMTMHHFGEQFEQMCMAFNASNMANRAKVYFKYLEDFTDQEFSAIAQHAIKNESRMPSISDMLTWHRKMFRSDVEKAKCPHCFGNGMMSIGRMVYRAPCQHGDRLKVKLQRPADSIEITMTNQKNAFGSLYGDEAAEKMLQGCESGLHGHKETGVDPWLTYMTKEPHKAFKGLVKILPLMKGKSKLYKELRDTVIEFYGEAYIKKHARFEQQKLTGLDEA